MVRAPYGEENGLKKGPWTPQEDEKLINYINKHGHGSWRALPKLAGLNRCGKSCRLRWINYLRPDIKRGNFTQEEQHTILNLHSILGNKWSAIAGHLPGRTDNEIKNYWHTHLKKKLIHMGFDPNTHLPQSHNIFHPLAMDIIQSWTQGNAYLQQLLHHLLQPSIPINPNNNNNNNNNNFIQMETLMTNFQNPLLSPSLPFSHLPNLQNPNGGGGDDYDSNKIHSDGGSDSNLIWLDEFLLEDPLFLENIG